MLLFRLFLVAFAALWYYVPVAWGQGFFESEAALYQGLCDVSVPGQETRSWRYWACSNGSDPKGMMFYSYSLAITFGDWDERQMPQLNPETMNMFPRYFFAGTGNVGADLTPKRCTTACRAFGYRHAILNDGFRCSCSSRAASKISSNYLARGVDVIDNGYCQDPAMGARPCPGDGDQYCGGLAPYTGASAVYQDYGHSVEWYTPTTAILTTNTRAAT